MAAMPSWLQRRHDAPGLPKAGRVLVSWEVQYRCFLRSRPDRHLSCLPGCRTARPRFATQSCFSLCLFSVISAPSVVQLPSKPRAAGKRDPGPKN
jgi:hypothetical protein